MRKHTALGMFTAAALVFAVSCGSDDDDAGSESAAETTAAAAGTTAADSGDDCRGSRDDGCGTGHDCGRCGRRDSDA